MGVLPDVLSLPLLLSGAEPAVPLVVGARRGLLRQARGAGKAGGRLPDAVLLLSLRGSGYTHRRARSHSPDSLQGPAPPRPQPLGSPGCQPLRDVLRGRMPLQHQLPPGLHYVRLRLDIAALARLALRKVEAGGNRRSLHPRLAPLRLSAHQADTEARLHPGEELRHRQ